MPELPEVETIRRDLDREVGGRKIKSVEVKRMKTIHRHPNKKSFIASLEDAKIKSVARTGKWLRFVLDSGNVLVCHLGMSGRLLRAQNKDDVLKHTHVIIQFTQGGQLRFVDPRGFGEMFVTAPDELANALPELAALGLDAIEEPISWTEFGGMLHSRKVKLKTLLMDQKFLAGLGNIYSDEILFQSGLRYDRSSDSLTPQEVRRLYRAVVETLHDAMKYRGSTLDDGSYTDIFGAPGSYQEHHQVYDREGDACPRCRTPIVKSRISNRSTFYCAQCQV
jgi:formamidopyrimidine-DNA glycosylase